jgi:hypothetical protein
MREITGNLWDYHDDGWWIAITTNGCIRRDGTAVMGRGCAAQAANRYPTLPRRLGARLQTDGNRLFVWEDWHLITFPVKHRWWEQADLRLIEQSAQALLDWLNTKSQDTQVVVPRPGCGNGRLDWRVVRPVLAAIWDDRVLVISPQSSRREAS